MLLRLALRNMLRNRRRSALTGLVIAIGLASTLFTDAYIKGLEVNLVRSATDGFLGHAQVHAPEFRRTHEVERTLAQSDLVQRLSQDPRIRAFAHRVTGIAMLSSAQEVQSVMLMGVDPDREKAMSKLAQAIQTGRQRGIKKFCWGPNWPKTWVSPWATAWLSPWPKPILVSFRKNSSGWAGFFIFTAKA